MCPVMSLFVAKIDENGTWNHGQGSNMPDLLPHVLIDKTHAADQGP